MTRQIFDPSYRLYAATGALAAGFIYCFYELRKARKELHALQESQTSSKSNVLGEAVLAAVECGGTTCRAAIAMAAAPTVIIHQMEIPTEDPEPTVRKLINWLESKQPFDAIGIASFGPLDLRPNSATYGHITTTPKRPWRQFDLVSPFRKFNKPVGFETDVNAPALAELAYGGHQEITGCAYITVGTGVGVGVAIDGKPVHGLVHPEGGHIMPLRMEGDNYIGWDEVQRDAVESLISARAISERTGVPESSLATLPDSHPVWNIIGYYLANLCLAITYLLSPEVIVVSGGILKRECLFPLIHKHFVKLNNGFVSVEKTTTKVDQYIVPSKFGNDIGLIGAIEVARRTLLSA